MPELPEVERGRRIAESVAAGRRVKTCRVRDDRIVFDGVAPDTFRRTLVGRTVHAVLRRGKHIWFELDRPPLPLFHFGMTGAFRVRNLAPLPLASSPNPQADTWPPRFTKVHLVLDDGGELAFTNARRLGRIRLRTDPLREPPLSELGFDPLLDLPSQKRLAALLRKRAAVLKALLLDQSFAAGVGNWIADEILYHARIDPRRRANSLSEEEVSQLRAKMRYIVSRAVSVNAQKERFPRTWLFHRRWGKQKNARTARGERIEHTAIAGRTTAWVPEVQH